MIYYCLAEVIYQSPHSTLYRAFSKDQDRQVVLKCFEADARGMYLREMSGFGIEHPNLVACLETFYLGDGRPCMVYEFFHDGTLEQWLATHGNANLDFCYHCLEEILQALIYLNQHKRIHCDLKPGNIFLRLSADQPTVFVLGDFGATCSLREAQESRYGVGTPAYMAPERLYDHFFYNSDLYSLGIMAYELITGQRPFLGTPEEIKRAHLGKLADLTPITDLPLRDFIERLLEKDPQRRISDAETALLILTAVRQGQKIAEEVSQTVEPIIEIQPLLTATKFTQYFPCAMVAPPNKTLIFEIADELIIGLEYDSHVDLCCMDSGKHDIVLKNGITQIQQSSSFFYTSSLKVLQFDLNHYQRHCVYQFNKTIDYFEIKGDYLLLRSKYETVYCHLRNHAVFKFSQPHYFSTLQTCILANGNFCLSGGMTNQLLILRDPNTNMIAQWQLQGPIIAVTCAGEDLLALTFDMQDSSCYWLCGLTAHQPARYVKFSSQEIVHYCQTNGYLFWLTSRNQLYRCGVNLIPQLVTQLPTDLPISAFQLSINHRWLITFSYSSRQEYNMTCFKAAGE